MSGRAAEALLQVGIDGVGFVHPLFATIVMGDQQARHLDATATLFEGLAVSGVVLGVALLDVQVQLMHALAHLDAERVNLRDVNSAFANQAGVPALQ